MIYPKEERQFGYSSYVFRISSHLLREVVFNAVLSSSNIYKRTDGHLLSYPFQPNLRNKIEQGVDKSLLRDIPKCTKVVRCKSVELSHLYYLLYKLHVRKALFEIERLTPLMHMDYKLGWYPFALNAAKRIIDRSSVKVIYSTSPPYAAHFLGRQLQKAYGLPWVADFEIRGH